MVAHYPRFAASNPAPASASTAGAFALVAMYTTRPRRCVKSTNDPLSCPFEFAQQKANTRYRALGIFFKHGTQVSRVLFMRFPGV